MHLRLVLMLVVLTLVGAALVRCGGGSEPAALRPERYGPEAVQPAASELEVPSEAAPPGAPAERRPAAVVPEDSGSDAPAEEGAQRVTLEGSWTVLDGELEHVGVDGSFTIRLYTPREDIEIPVEGGRWSVELPPDGMFDIRSIELGGRPTAPVDEPWQVAVPADLRLDLTARWAREVVLEVVDAATGVQLADLTIVGEGMGLSWEHPGPIDPERVILRHVASPVRLPVPENPGDTETLWVSGPGYGWGRIEVPRSVGGDFLLALHPAGRIEARVVGAPEGVALALRLRANTDASDWRGQRYEEWIDAREVVVLESLAADRYVVTVELGHRYGYPRILAFQEVDLTATDRAEVVLDVSAYEPPELTQLSGTLVVPPGWGFERFNLFLKLVEEPAIDGEPQKNLTRGDMELVDEESGEYAFARAGLQPGRWELSFNPLGTSMAVDLPPGGLRDVRLEVPPPVAVTVNVRDEQGSPVSDMRILWMPDRSDLVSGGVLNSAGQTAPGTFTFTAPQGPVEIWCMSDTWSFRRQVVDLDPVAHELDLEATPAAGLLLSIRDGDTLLPVADFDPVVQLVDSDEKGYLSDEDLTGLTWRIVVPGPGLYSIQLTPPDGYAEVEPVTLSIAPEEFAKVTIRVPRE